MFVCTKARPVTDLSFTALTSQRTRLVQIQRETSHTRCPLEPGGYRVWVASGENASMPVTPKSEEVRRKKMKTEAE